MSFPFPERPTDRDRASSQRGGQEFAAVCGRLHFFLLPTDAPPDPGRKKCCPAGEKMTDCRVLTTEN
jgi:hypothetical protein